LATWLGLPNAAPRSWRDEIEAVLQTGISASDSIQQESTQMCKKYSAAGAPAKEIEITPEMVRAGELAILQIAGDIIPPVGGEARGIARAVYRAMRSMQRASSHG
jgi:hypothetical protein